MEPLPACKHAVTSLAGGAKRPFWAKMPRHARNKSNDRLNLRVFPTDEVLLFIKKATFPLRKN
jgi:hypothetical protein